MQGSKTATVVKSKSKKTQVSNQVKLDVKNPIPFEFGGTAFSFLQGHRYIPFLFPEDDFFKTLLEAKMLSPTHQMCVETKKLFCAGRGLQDKSEKVMSPELRAWLDCINKNSDNDLDINRKIFGSHFTFGNTPVEIVRFKVAGKPRLFVYVHNALEWRLGWYNKNGDVTEAIHSKLFLRVGIISGDVLKDAKVLPLYNVNNTEKANWQTDEKGVQRTLIWIKNQMDGYDDYGMPSAVSSIGCQLLEYKGIRFNLDNFENNMVLGGILALKGNLSPEEANKIAKTIINTHTGDGKRGRVAVVASEEGIDKSDFHSYTTQTDGSYLKLDDNLVAKIIQANSWDPLLCGIAPTHSLGRGNTFLKTAYEIKKKTVIDPAQDYIISKFWKIVLKIAADWLHNGADQIDPEITDIDPISILADVDPTPAVKVNEIRDIIGLKPDTGPMGEKYLGELKPVQSASSSGQGGGGENV